MLSPVSWGESCSLGQPRGGELVPQILEGLSVLLISIGVMALLLGFGRGLEGMSRRQVMPPAARQGEEGLGETARRVLSVIRAHSEGIRLVEIGDELGVDWRLLTFHVNRLLQHGLIRKEDRRYYPL